MYDNLYPWRPGKERRALITALILGKILNRIVILPKFHCYACVAECNKRADNTCAFNALFHVKSFDYHFSGQYREHGFLKHPKIPDTITGSITPKIHIATKGNQDKDRLALRDTIRINPKNKTRILEKDIINWFGHGSFSNFAVLSFHSLDFNIQVEDTSWLNIFDDALKVSNYRQQNLDDGTLITKADIISRK